MKYTRNLPKDDPKRISEIESEGWILLKEPNNPFVTFLLSLPFAFLGAYLGIIAFPELQDYITSLLNNLFDNPTISLTLNLQYIVDLYGYVILHELLHISCVPHFMKSEKTYFSVQIWGGFAFTEEIISKRRFIIMALLPYVLLTFVIPGILLYGGLPLSLIALLVIANGIGSCMDILFALVVYFQVPNGAKVRYIGTKTFYKCN